MQEEFPVRQVACGQQFVQHLQSGHEGLALLHEERFLLGGAYALLLAEGALAPRIALPLGAGIVVACCGLSRTLHAAEVNLEKGASAGKHLGGPCPELPPWPALCVQIQVTLKEVLHGIGHA